MSLVWVPAPSSTCTEEASRRSGAQHWEINSHYLITLCHHQRSIMTEVQNTLKAFEVNIYSITLAGYFQMLAGVTLAMHLMIQPGKTEEQSQNTHTVTKHQYF